MPKDPELADMERRAAPITTLLVFVLIVFLIQLWLIGIALEDRLAARHGLALPTWLASGACFALNGWLLHYLWDVDRKREKGP